MKTPATIAALLLAVPAVAETREDERLWVNVTATGSASGRLLYFAEVQTRVRDGATENDQLLLRPAIGWQVSDRLALYQGYARVVNNPATGPDRFENRSFQQANVAAGKVGAGALSFRLRLEQRWLEDGEGTGWRARSMVRYALPLRAGVGGAKLLGWAEPFVALNDTRWGQRGGFDQLRSFVGVELPVGRKSTVELGYLNQFVNRSGGDADINHVASVTVFIRP